MAGLIAFIHLMCLLFLIFGFFFNPPITFFHLIAIPAVTTHWWLNNNQCFLTQLQKKFEANTSEITKNLEGSFTRSILLKVGISLTDQQMKLLIYSVMGVSWALSLIKFL